MAKRKSLTEGSNLERAAAFYLGIELQLALRRRNTQMDGSGRDLGIDNNPAMIVLMARIGPVESC